MNVGFASLLPGAAAGAGDAPAPRSAGGLEHRGPAGAEGGAGTAFASLLLTLLGVDEGDAPSGNGQGAGSGPDAEGEAASGRPEGPAPSRDAPAARRETHTAVAALPATQATRAGWATLAAGTSPASGTVVDTPRPAGSRDPEPTGGATRSGPSAAEVPVDFVPPVEGGSPVHPVAAPAAPVPPVAADVRVADRSLARLHPELKARVGRVMERMQKEHGLSVTLAEGYRTQERQDFLFAQGRTAPGPVVTWTRDSNHNRGRAADLKVEGSWRQPEAYAHLQRIAREEGLGTLGMKDPGHVELKGEGHAPWSPPAVGGSGELPGRLERSPWRAAQPRGVHGAAPVAAVARTAQVARPASPGRVDAEAQLALHAQPALDGAHAPAPRTPAAPVGSPSLDTVARTAPTVQVARTAPTYRVDAREPASAGPGDGVLREVPPPEVELHPTVRPGAPVDANQAPQAPDAVRVADLGVSPAPRAVAAPSMDAMAGVERALEAREAMATSPVRRVTLRMEGENGAVQRVRVDLADRVLRSQVEVADPHLASRLQADGSAVLRALEARGYEAPEVTVAGVAAASTRGDAGPDLLASLARGDALPQALRALFGEAPAAGGGRGNQDPWTRQHLDRGQGQDGFQQHSRRENRREGR